MNEHLAPVFEEILPAIEEAHIDYWVYGGVGVAGVKGKFIRFNEDVDIFVRERDLLKAVEILSTIAAQHAWLLKEDRKTVPERPKYEILVSGKEIFAVVPLFEESHGVDFLFYHLPPQKYPLDILKRELRQVSNFNFYSFEDKYIKDLLLLYIHRLGKKILTEPKRMKYQDDARCLLSSKEFEKLASELK